MNEEDYEDKYTQILTVASQLWPVEHLTEIASAKLRQICHLKYKD